MKNKPHPSRRFNRWKGVVLGFMGGAVGLAAMRFYWQKIAPEVEKQLAEPAGSSPGDRPEQPLDDISLVGKLYEDGESSTAALGRLMYGAITGSEPRSQETKTALSYLVHWVYGMFQGGVYGALWGHRPALEVKSGLVFGTGLWLFGDELFLPFMGLQSGPTSVPMSTHVNRLGAHLAYGAGTALATKLIGRFI